MLAPDAVSVLELPVHRFPVGDIAMAAVGSGFTLTCLVAWSVQPLASVPVTVYVTVVVGDAVTLVPVVALNPVAGAQV